MGFQIGDEWNLITRTILPFIEQKDIAGKDETESGLGDILESMFFSPIAPTEGGLILGC
jgi:hypothetical protein